MKSSLAFLVLAGVVLSVIAAGCTSPTGVLMNIGTTTTAATETLAPDTVSATSATIAPVQTLPPEQYVDVQLSKERPDYSIHLLYNGGKGEVNIQNIFLKVTLSDGQVIEKYMNDNQRQPRRGDEIIVRGTRGSDRVEVYVTSAGKTYKVIDRELQVSRL